MLFHGKKVYANSPLFRVRLTLSVLHLIFGSAWAQAPQPTRTPMFLFYTFEVNFHIRRLSAPSEACGRSLFAVTKATVYTVITCDSEIRLRSGQGF